MKRWILIGFLLVTGFAATARAEDDKDTGPQLPVPRFVTLGSDEVNLRAGPGVRYPAKLVLRREGLPVRIVKEFDVWRQVQDKEGDEGWVHKSLLSGKRAVIIEGVAGSGAVQTLLRKPDPAARPVVKLEPGVIAGLDRCEKDWCRLTIASYKGWIPRARVWGVLPGETFEK